MPRARPRIPSLPTPPDTSTPFSFSDTEKENIIGFLNLDDKPKRAKQAISRIEKVISLYPLTLETVKALDIRPAHRLAELTPLFKAAQKTSKCMSEISNGTWCKVAHIDLPLSYTVLGLSLTQIEQEQKEKAWQVLDDFKRSLPLFISSLERVINDLTACERRGGQRTPALDVTVTGLIFIFKEYYHPKPRGTDKARELAKSDIVSTVLEAANREGIIPAIPDTDEGIKILMERSQKLVLTAEDFAPPQEK